MSPRTGRPTQDPKNSRLEIRLSDCDSEKLEYCCKQTGKSKAEILRMGIEKVYEEINKK